jgi:GNAT superfamily N-acetyltransferase
MEHPMFDLELARRIELAEAEAAVEGAEVMMAMKPDVETAVERLAGGYAVYCGANSPVTQAVGLGLNGPVHAEEFDRLENFYFTRKEPVRVETCPLADATLMEFYGQRGYRVTEFSSVLAKPIARQAAPASANGLQIRRASREEADLWTLTVAQGFAEHFPVTQELLGVMKMFALGKNMECYLARIEGRVVGGAALSLRGSIAGFFGASTLPEFRKRGVQTALLQARLQRAAEAGCEMGVSLTQVSSASQRNITRQGFRVLYTRVKFERAFPESGASAS